MNKHYERLNEIEAVVKGFESCDTAKDDFTHAKHLTVAVFYLYDLSESQATEKMRNGLLRFLNHHGVGPAKYHETLTVFWIKILRSFLVQLDPETPLLDMTNKSLERFRDSHLVFDYYSTALLHSNDARTAWQNPDIKQLPGN